MRTPTHRNTRPRSTPAALRAAQEALGAFEPEAAATETEAERKWNPTDEASRAPEGAAWKSGYATSPRAQAQPAVMDLDRIRLNTTNTRIHIEDVKKDGKPTDIDHLAETIRQVGIIHPISVRPLDSRRADPTKDIFEAIAGDRRLTAAKRAGLREVPVVIRFDMQGEKGETDAALLNLVENVTRKDLHATELANGLAKLKKRMQTDLDAWLQPRLSRRRISVAPGEKPPRVESSIYRDLLAEEPPSWAVASIQRAAEGTKAPAITVADLARFMGLSEPYIKQLTALTRLPQKVQERAKEAGLSFSVMREISYASQPETQSRLATLAIKNDLSDDEVRAARLRLEGKPLPAPRPAPSARQVEEPEIEEAEDSAGFEEVEEVDQEDGEGEEVEDLAPEVSAGAVAPAAPPRHATTQALDARDALLRDAERLVERARTNIGLNSSVWSKEKRAALQAHARALLEIAGE